MRFAPLLVCLMLVIALPFQVSAKTVTDVAGREVVLPDSPQRIFLGFYYTDYLAVGGADAFDHVVGFSKDVWSKWTPASWQLYRRALAKLNALADAGEFENGTFSIEKLLAMKPDVAVFARWQFDTLGDELEQMEKAGIAVVVVDYNAQTPELHALSTRIFGVITAQEERAEALASGYEAVAAQIQQRLAEAKRPKPKIYLEFGNHGPAQYGVTYGKNMWGALAVLAGGDNIAAEFVEWWGMMNPEQVLAAQPEVIVITGRETEYRKNTEAMVMGVGIPEAEARRRLQRFTTRAGWEALPAVRDGRVYGVYQGAARSLIDQVMLQFLAKALYPDLFADFDPQQAWRDFHEQWLPVQPEGTFMLPLRNGDAG
jgi:ABC-type Fe3+-hydroxamate transport system substrate-binding protein